MAKNLSAGDEDRGEISVDQVRRSLRQTRGRPGLIAGTSVLEAADKEGEGTSAATVTPSIPEPPEAAPPQPPEPPVAAPPPAIAATPAPEPPAAPPQPPPTYVAPSYPPIPSLMPDDPNEEVPLQIFVPRKYKDLIFRLARQERTTVRGFILRACASRGLPVDEMDLHDRRTQREPVRARRRHPR
jgi:hypothetical protein